MRHSFHVVTVGWDYSLIRSLWNRLAAKSGDRFSHIVHPRYSTGDWPGAHENPDIYFFRKFLRQPMPSPDRPLLASLERSDIPTIHNMILGDRIVSKLPYEAALGYATFLARRLGELFRELAPSAVIGGFDALHAGIALAVARSMEIPWFAMHFSVIPPGLVCLCDGMSPATRVLLSAPAAGLRELAEQSLQKFASRKVQVPAFIAPPSMSLAGHIARLPRRLVASLHAMRRAQLREFLRFTEPQPRHSLSGALALLRRGARAHTALKQVPLLHRPPSTRYVFFGLHLQPESSIDVWAPFFSNQMWVIELLSRSIPATHRLLVKIHKSDIANYSQEQLARMRSFPGVELVAPLADARSFIESADLVVAIQGTIGLEAALLGKPVIMLGESPVTLFPSACRIGELTDLPMLIRRKLAEPAARRGDIVEAYAQFLAPFRPASHNDWTRQPDDSQIDGFVRLFAALKEYLNSAPRSAHESGIEGQAHA